MDEIASWTAMSDDQRRSAGEAARARLAALKAKPGPSAPKDR
jgi:predicted Fe-S protein YdhL (DUF1289 family)